MSHLKVKNAKLKPTKFILQWERNNWTVKHRNKQINNNNDKEGNVGRNRWAWSWWVDCWNASGNILFNTMGPILKGDWLLDSWRWDRYVDPKRRQITTDLRCVTSRKSGYLIYTAAGAYNHSRTVFFFELENKFLKMFQMNVSLQMGVLDLCTFCIHFIYTSTS